MSFNCDCQEFIILSEYKRDFQKYRHEILEELLKLRENCEALKNFFLPNDKIKKYSYKMLGIFDKTEGRHESVLIRAMMENKLKFVTSPIHKFLLNPNARKDYVNNINDYWILEEIFENRQKKYYKNYDKF